MSTACAAVGAGMSQLTAERSAQEMNLETRDCVEGVRAFFEKREPHFSEDF